MVPDSVLQEGGIITGKMREGTRSISKCCKKVTRHLESVCVPGGETKSIQDNVLKSQELKCHRGMNKAFRVHGPHLKQESHPPHLKDRPRARFQIHWAPHCHGHNFYIYPNDGPWGLSAWFPVFPPFGHEWNILSQRALGVQNKEKCIGYWYTSSPEPNIFTLPPDFSFPS